ncbi:MAG TPA: hypothetical protein VF663_00320, partial [Telluria sp.]
PVLDRLKKQERNDRQTALLPRIQRSRIIPNKSKKTRSLQNKTLGLNNRSLNQQLASPFAAAVG